MVVASTYIMMHSDHEAIQKEIKEGSIEQITLTVTSKDISGMTQGVPVIFKVDPLQVSKDTLLNVRPYKIDAGVSITIHEIPALTAFILYFYPAQNNNHASQLIAAKKSANKK